MVLYLKCGTKLHNKYCVNKYNKNKLNNIIVEVECGSTISVFLVNTQINYKQSQQFQI